MSQKIDLLNLLHHSMGAVERSNGISLHPRAYIKEGTHRKLKHFPVCLNTDIKEERHINWQCYIFERINETYYATFITLCDHVCITFSASYDTRNKYPTSKKKKIKRIYSYCVNV